MSESYTLEYKGLVYDVEEIEYNKISSTSASEAGNSLAKPLVFFYPQIRFSTDDIFIYCPRGIDNIGDIMEYDKTADVSSLSYENKTCFLGEFEHTAGYAILFKHGIVLGYKVNKIYRLRRFYTST